MEELENIIQPTDISNGLSSADVEKRIQEGKVNGEQTIHTKSVAQILKENILTFFNLVFVVLAIILSFFAFSDSSSEIGGIGNFGFLILIVFNTAAGIIQGLRSKFTMDKLSLLSAPKAIVVRDGEEKEIAIENIVLDDIMILSSGKQICADSVVVDGSCEVNESLITGEPDAILKTPGDKVMSGSFVVSGKAKCQVEHVAMDNFVMKISAGAKYFKRPSSEIWRSLMYVVKIMSIIIVPVGVALFLVKYLLQNIDLNETVITVISTVIGMIPSGLVALATTVFCVSVIRLSKNNTLAQDLYCIETLARVDVLCLDKTGTITEGSMEVNECLPKNIEENDFKQLLKDFTSALNAEYATSVAIKNFVSDFEQKAEIGTIVPFSSSRKWSGATLDNKSYVLGAPGFVFKTPQAEITEKTAEMAEKGYRVLVFASSDNAFDGQTLPEGLSLCGFVFITDKIRKEAPDTLAFFKKEGVNVKIISGDNPVTVRAVALRAGLENCDNIIDMSTLSTVEEIEEAAEKYTIFGRVLPDQKLALVQALKKPGHTVAMTGDGVNDVLALKEADCSIAMASGSDAAKNVSSLVLLDSNFASMPKVVAEGRRSINNLERSASLYIMKTIYNTLLAVLFLFIPNALPFEPRHLTIIGMVTIGIPSVIIALEPNHDIVKGHFLPKVLSNAISGSIVVLLGAVCILITYNCFLKDLTDAQITNLYIVITTFVGLVYLFKVSLPFSWLHMVTLVLMIGLFVACYFVKLPFTIGNLDMTNFIQDFFGLSNNFTAEMAYAIVGIGGTLVAIYIVLIFAMRNINKKGDDSVMCKFLRKKNVI
ncbi:MAG: HAD-IC family P-type ATPase [Clostridia bacterium]|nr:HAD-IC family P-type ATPase [Clostridia bacterium]